MAQAAAVNLQVQAAVQAAAAGADFVLDAAALADFDTSALALLLEARRGSQRRGLGFVVSNPPAKLKQLAVMYGVDGLLGLSPA
jgi:phospholipid transport system transporter-binding protein